MTAFSLFCYIGGGWRFVFCFWCVNEIIKNKMIIQYQNKNIIPKQEKRNGSDHTKKTIKKNKKLLQKLLTNFLYYSIIIIVKREEEKTNEKENKKTNKKNVALYNRKYFIIWIIYIFIFIRFEHQPNNNKIIKKN